LMNAPLGDLRNYQQDQLMLSILGLDVISNTAAEIRRDKLNKTSYNICLQAGWPLLDQE